ncbi:uncharacterized protein LOC111701784 isoform X2 [Eurytemora carolleeae]|uniref:uncharacterized protein LOC111701784 isoform X2 n=1 Tax=Eurytemora carolleeae TaxID=1294199 RepID=UPI000C75CE6A|nr:uncharacterized protein LOC111701784 isoform X2 [Eurytemora carolleeae]|eukprot:XP_023328971.1 uncharacterized protein LOC111701784 isoform X2 [Eurytemora affinis]
MAGLIMILNQYFCRLMLLLFPLISAETRYRNLSENTVDFKSKGDSGLDPSIQDSDWDSSNTDSGSDLSRQDFASNANKKNSQTGDGRLFSLFTIVQFKNMGCVSGNFTGTCMTSSECISCGGSGSGSCAAGFGVCCIVRSSTCDSMITTNTTYISSSDTSGGSCSYKIAIPSNVCQIRLDFLKLELDGPTNNAQTNLGGRCNTDKFSIQQTSSPTSLTLCGNSTGQHIYFDVSEGDVAELKFILDQTVGFRRGWELLINYMECGQSVPGCTQYFTGNSGTITSFNYYNTEATRRVHLSGLDYTICIRRETGSCCLRLNPTITPDGYDLNGVTCASDCNTAQTCRTDGTDHLLIPQANEDGKDPTSYTRFCGTLTNVFSVATSQHPLVTCSVPFNLHFHSAMSGNSGNTRGFNLKYVQLPCRHF